MMPLGAVGERVTIGERTTVGVFDSGFGGLTVLRELLSLIADAHFVYLGDTARLPYGAKSQATVARYAVEAARFLISRGAQLLVIACNTATALALDDIRQAVSVPVIGVIEPGAQAALSALTQEPASVLHRRDPAPQANRSLTTEDPLPPPSSRHPGPEVQDDHISPVHPTPPRVLVLATAATVASHAYRDTCAALGLAATEKACPLLVPLVEEGWTDHPVTREVLRLYLSEALGEYADVPPQAVLLGCTHYPLLSAEIRKTLAGLGSQAVVIDSAHATALAAQGELAQLVRSNHASGRPSTFECFATDSMEKFARLGSLFLGRTIPAVQLLDLGG